MQSKLALYSSFCYSLKMSSFVENVEKIRSAHAQISAHAPLMSQNEINAQGAYSNKYSILGLALDSIHQNHLGHLIETYITDLLVSFQLRLGLAVHIVKFRPKPPRS